jgi:Dna[CI] antecedent, DciA
MKCIFLRVPNSTWRNELKFREQQITKKINSYYNEERIKQVRFVP